MIFDEPFSGFDPINAELMKEEILRMSREGATIIFSIHNMESVEELCDHIALIDKSRKILDGPTLNIREQYKSNIFDVAYKGDFATIEQEFSKKYSILAHDETGRTNSLKIQFLNGSNSGSLIKDLVNHVEIVSFNELIPSMNDVFIKVVKQNS